MPIHLSHIIILFGYCDTLLWLSVRHYLRMEWDRSVMSITKSLSTTLEGGTIHLGRKPRNSQVNFMKSFSPG